MRKLVRLGKLNPANRHFAQRLVARIPPKQYIQEMRRCFNFVRRGIRYSLDTNGVEVLQSPEVTLDLKYGDCDDKCILLACLFETLGHASAFMALSFDGPDEFSHVIVISSPAADGQEIACDPTEPEPMGWFPPGVKHAMLCPI